MLGRNAIGNSVIYRIGRRLCEFGHSSEFLLVKSVYVMDLTHPILSISAVPALAAGNNLFGNSKIPNF